MIENSPFSHVDQIGIIVRDVDKAAEYYESLGIGPFHAQTGTVLMERRVWGKLVTDIKNKVLLAQIGPIEIELVQPVEGISLQMDFLETKGEGINHLGFLVDDLDKEVAKLSEQGIEPVMTVKFQGGGGVAYMDTDEVGGVLLELIQYPPG